MDIEPSEVHASSAPEPFRNPEGQPSDLASDPSPAGLVASSSQGVPTQEAALPATEPPSLPTENASCPSGFALPKPRSIKTPIQKEALEAAYQVNKFPDEDVRRMLGERIGLKEQQIQVWFSHKRRKEKKEQEDAAIRASVEQKLAEEKAAAQADGREGPPERVPMDTDAVQSSMAPPASQANQPARTAPTDVAALPQSAAPPLSSEVVPSSAPQPGLSAPNAAAPPAPPAAAASEAPADVQESVPPANAAPASVFSESVQRTVDLAKHPTPVLTPEERADIPILVALAKRMLPVPYREDGPPLVFEFDDPPLIRPDGTYADEEPTSKRKRVDGDDDEVARNRRASAGAKGASRTEMEKVERERRRTEERAERDRRKQEAARTKEEMRLRVLQEREEKKLQAQAEKDRKAQERKDKLHERRKEKEMLKALQAQEKQATRLRQRDVGTGPPDDLDVEWETLVAAQREAGYTSGTEGEGGEGPSQIVRPEFPPNTLAFSRLLPEELSDEAGGNLLFIWSFLHSFGDLLGLGVLTVDQLLQSLVDSNRSRLSGEVHIAMLRIVQADMEEAYATGAMQSGSAINFLDRAIVSCAATLEEAWAWGFDVDAWRAHVNALTWPEVLRQIAITWGLGSKRPKPKKEMKPKMGTDGEDVIIDESGVLKLRLPARFGVGTVKAAAWQVLAEAGPEGLMIAEIARRIQQSGLRDLRTSKTPEASVAGALSRDVIFARIAPATYGLQAVVTYHNKLIGSDNTANGDTKSPSPVDKAKGKQGSPGAKEPSVKPEEAGKASEERDKKSEEREEEEEENEGESSGDEEEAPEEKLSVGEAWVEALKSSDYGDMSLTQRITILAALVHLTIDGPTMRNTLEARLEEAGRVRKQMWEEAKAEKKKKQEEAAAKAKAAAAEAQRAMEIIKTKEGSATPARALDGPTPEPACQPAANLDGANGAKTPGASHLDTPEPEIKPEAKDEVPGPQHDSTAPTAKHEDRAAIEANGSKPLDALAKGTPAPSIERAHSGVAPSEGGFSRRAEGDDDLTAAAAAKQRHLQRAETIRKAEEANAIRGEPLGLDRRYNKYWRFADMDSAYDDPFSGRLVVESSEDGSYRILNSIEGVDGLIAALDKRGAREGNLYNALLSYRDALTQSMPSEPMKMPSERTEESREQLETEHEDWLRGIPCVAAGKIRGKAPKATAAEPHLAQLKTHLLIVEKALPRDALRAEWDAGVWRASVKNAGGPLDVRRALSELESAVQEGWISLAFKRDPLLVRGAWLSTGKEVASALPGNSGEIQQLPQRKEEEEPSPPQDLIPLAWLPPTIAAVALRLQALDASLHYSPKSLPAREELLAYRYTQRPVVLPKKVGQDVSRESAFEHRISPLCGHPVVLGGRALPSLPPPFPLALLTGEQQTFSMDWAKLCKEIADEKAGILPPPIIPPRLALQQTVDKAGRNSRTRAPKGSAKGSKAGKGKGAKGSKAKSKQSALREEFDRQSEEEEAAERRGFSTPGFSDDDSDFGQPSRGRKHAREDEEMEISD